MNMKRFGLFLTVLILFCGLVSAQNEKISFNETEHDFGEIYEKDGNATFDFVLTNRSDAPIVISNVTTSCGCTTPAWTKEPIESGKTGKISVAYSTQGRIGPFVKDITVFIDKSSPSRLKIKGNVLRDGDKKTTSEQAFPVAVGDFLLKTKELNFGNVDLNETKTIRLEAFNNSDKPVTIKALKVPKYLTVAFSPAVVPAKTAANIVVNLNLQNENQYGDLSGEIQFQINETRQSFPYSVVVKEDFSKWTAQRKANAGKLNVPVSIINFGNFKSGNSRTLKMSNSGKSTLNIHAIQSSDPLVTVSKPQFTINPGEIAEVKIIVDNKKVRSKLSSKLTIIADDPNTPTFEITIIAEADNKS